MKIDHLLPWNFEAKLRDFQKPDSKILKLTPAIDIQNCEDGSFDLVLAYEVPYDLTEVRRVMKPGGYFFTQQRGGRDEGPEPSPADYNLENQCPVIAEAGFRIMYRHQAYTMAKHLEHRFIIIAQKRKQA